jgi:hypothetical protein
LVESEKGWITKMENGLGDINRRLSKVDSRHELQCAVDDLVSLAEKWRRANQEQFYGPGEDE